MAPVAKMEPQCLRRAASPPHILSSLMGPSWNFQSLYWTFWSPFKEELTVVVLFKNTLSRSEAPPSSLCLQGSENRKGSSKGLCSAQNSGLLAPHARCTVIFHAAKTVDIPQAATKPLLCLGFLNCVMLEEEMS